MTMGTATVASTKVRGTAGSVRSQPPTARSRAVSGWPWSADFFQGRAVEGRWGSGGDVLGDEVAVECDREAPEAVMTWARALTALPAAQTPGTVVRPAASVRTRSRTRATSSSALDRKRGRTNTAVHDTNR